MAILFPAGLVGVHQLGFAHQRLDLLLHRTFRTPS
jgi:hypothetical protein